MSAVQSEALELFRKKNADSQPFLQEVSNNANPGPQDLAEPSNPSPPHLAGT